MAQINDVSGLFREYIVPDVADTFEQEDSLCSFFKKGKSVPVSDRATRIELKVNPGGQTAGMNFDGGAYPVGSNFLIVEALLTTIGLTHARQVTELANWSTSTPKKAILDVLADSVATGMDEFKAQIDKLLQGAGDGVMAILETVASAPTYSVAAAGNPWGTQLLREGNPYDIYDSTLVTLRANGPYTVDPNGGLDYAAETVRFLSSITGGSIGDRVVFRNLVNAALQGLAYHINDSASGTWQNIARTEPYVRCLSVDAGNTSLDWSLVRLSLNKIRQRKGTDKTKMLTPYYGLAQQQAYEAQAQQISEIIRGGSSGVPKPEDYDLMMGEAKIQGRTPLVNINADPTKFQWIERKAFMWAEIKPIGFKEDDGNYLFPLYGTSQGGVTAPIASNWFSLVYQAQLGCTDVTNMSYIKNLAVPDGYISNP